MDGVGNLKLFWTAFNAYGEVVGVGITIPITGGTR